jgi:hypothetical protein
MLNPHPRHSNILNSKIRLDASTIYRYLTYTSDNVRPDNYRLHTRSAVDSGGGIIKTFTEQNENFI